MPENDPVGLGSLEIRVGSDFDYLRASLPVEVRDAHQRVIVSRTGDWSGTVPGGIYSINAMDANGFRVRKLVQVVPGKLTRILLGSTGSETDVGAARLETGEEPVLGAPELVDAEPEFAYPSAESFDSLPTLGLRPPRQTSQSPAGREYLSEGADEEDGSASRWPLALPGIPPSSPSLPPSSPPRFTQTARRGAQLLEVERCDVRGDADGWRFLPHESLDAVPTARFGVGDREWLLSLPLNPASADPALASCRVAEVDTKHGRRLQLSFSPQRRLTAFMEGMRRSRNVEMVGDLLGEATELLVWKYEDPAGATLGCLALQRLGVLGDLRHWVENLEQGFGWIPDTQILLASVLVVSEEERSHALDLLLEASSRRPLYMDGLSLAVDLLRHWPGDDPVATRSAERKAALGHLGDLLAWSDWDAINLTTVTEGVA
jgi:hypothetical protein